MKYLRKVDWDTLLRTGSIDNVWDRFVNKLSIACKDNVPVYKSKPNHYETPGFSIVIYDALNAFLNFGFRLDKSPKYLRIIFGFLAYFLLITHLYF
jgi:hypothetical protein